MPEDPFGREIDYLRISVIDRCNLRCVYCMPLRDLTFIPGPELLTCAEIVTVVRAAVEVGFRKVRLTGGEPTLRADLIDIVEGIAGVEGIGDIGMTTNAILLPDRVKQLAAAGLSRINIHIDSLHPERLKRVMRFGHLGAMLTGLRAAEEAGLSPIKINCVVVRDYNDQDVVDMARLTMDRPWHVRFIELMPLGGGVCAQLSLSQFVPSAETRGRIESALGPLFPMPAGHPSDESRNYRFQDGRGVVGFISPVSEPYCGACNRMRLTADGKLHLCLLHDDEIDLKTALRNGGGVERIRELLLEAVAMKPTGHDLDKGVSTETRSMFQIGG